MSLSLKRMRQNRSAQDGMPSKRNGLFRQIRTLRFLRDGTLKPVQWNHRLRKLHLPVLPQNRRLPVQELMRRLKILLPTTAIRRLGIKVCFCRNDSNYYRSTGFACSQAKLALRISPLINHPHPGFVLLALPTTAFVLPSQPVAHRH